MRDHEEFKDILPVYAAIFEDCKYRTFEIPDMLNDILRLYQIYFRDTFYCGLSEADESRAGDSHAFASARIKRELAGTDQTELSRIQTRAQTLLRAHTKEMEEKYGKQRTTVND